MGIGAAGADDLSARKDTVAVAVDAIKGGLDVLEPLGLPQRTTVGSPPSARAPRVR